jgi:branched-chain amino acid transport system permease protein
MFETILYGFTIGAVLYLFSIGLSLTFGTMHIINFAHALVYSLGVYLFIAFRGSGPFGYLPAFLAAIVVMLPVAWAIERFVIRKLYGERLDYAIIATYALLLIGTDLIKLGWGSLPQPVSVPLGITIDIWGVGISLYRIIIVLCAIAIFLGLRTFFRRTVVGQIVVAALEDDEGVRCLGIDVSKYFSIVFVIGSVLAIVGGILYAPISTAEPYMGFHILLLAFSVVIVGGMGSLTGTFLASFALGMMMALVGRFWAGGSSAAVFLTMALVIIYRSAIKPRMLGR